MGRTEETAAGKAPDQACGRRPCSRRPDEAFRGTFQQAREPAPEGRSDRIGGGKGNDDWHLRVGAPGGGGNLEAPKGHGDLPRYAEAELVGGAHHHPDPSPRKMVGARRRKALHKPSPVLVEPQALGKHAMSE